MNLSRLVILICFVLLLGVPIVFRPAGNEQAQTTGNALELIIITPHNEQIRYEFGRAFDEWHARTFGQRVNVIYNVPGGTSEIRKMLEAQFTAAIESGREPGGDADLVFGGGSFEHGQLKRGVRIVQDSKVRWEPISTPINFSNEWLKQTYGENRIGDDPLYDKDKYWFGLALSGFGIVYNRDALRELHLPEPQRWDDLCDPKLQGWIALVNPNQSGSITTAFEAILKHAGWNEGWRILRRAGANARYFSASSLKPPIDVSQGNAALGVCIDFFGRYQSQALKEAGDADRVGYVDPVGGSTIDSDPISMLRNAPHPELARQFVEFCLSDEGQALWQLPRKSNSTANAGSDLGPQRFELRRMPITRSMYADHFDQFIDKVNPFELATPVEHPDPNFRDFIAPLFAAIAMDNHDELKAAWRAIVNHPDYSKLQELLGSDQLNSQTLSRLNHSSPVLEQMLELFDALPAIAGPNGKMYSLNDPAQLGEVRAGWLRGGWAKEGLWNPEDSPASEMRRRFAAFFRENYRQIVALAEEN